MASGPPEFLGTSGETAGPSGDILIGATTAYDTNVAALRAPSDERSMGGTYLAPSDGSGMNSPDAPNATTVSASGRPDTLIGGGGQELF
jgi:hypothetical protein